MKNKEAYQALIEHGLRPSVQRLAIMEYLLTHFTHPTADDVYTGLSARMSTLSRTTVYNTLRLFSEHQVAQMITIDDHHVCYDGNTKPHVHFYCRQCGKVSDLYDEAAPHIDQPQMVGGNEVDEVQLYYKGICAQCMNKNK